MGKVSIVLGFVAGLAVGFFALVLWGQFRSDPVLSLVLSLFSFFGFSIARWMVAVALFILGAVLVPFKRPFAAFVWGLGLALMT